MRTVFQKTYEFEERNDLRMLLCTLWTLRLDYSNKNRRGSRIFEKGGPEILPKVSWPLVGMSASTAGATDYTQNTHFRVLYNIICDLLESSF